MYFEHVLGGKASVLFPRHPGPPPEVRYLDHKIMPKTPSQEVFEQ